MYIIHECNQILLWHQRQFADLEDMKAVTN